MRFLFVKMRLGWPRTYGHDVHCYEMMRALRALGHEVALATEAPPAEAALVGLTLDQVWTLGEGTGTSEPMPLSYMQERYRSYWGVSRGRIADLQRHTTAWRADVLVVVGLEILPYLAGGRGAKRVWYAADEWVWHYVTQLRSDPGGAIEHVKAALIKGVYERAFGPAMDRVWVVSETERRAMRIVSGVRAVDVLPNGVDTETFAPTGVVPEPNSAVFWGRLGFGPNLHALRWFVGRVWPEVRRERPTARFSILGADPPDEVSALDGRDGIRVVANPIDLRPLVSQHAVVVLPFVSGGGIKNKFLEGAAMGRAIVATSKATSGLQSQPPVTIADTPAAFRSSLLDLWQDPARAAADGLALREWVTRHHSWAATASEAVRRLGTP